jgi:hypothetical protein
MQPGSNHRSELLLRFAKGALPIAIACILVSLTELKAISPAVALVLFAAGGLVLWLSWSAIRQNVVTKWLGVLLAFYIWPLLGLYLLGVTLVLALMLFPVFLIAVPLLAYDLLFRLPARDEPSIDDNLS